MGIRCIDHSTGERQDARARINVLEAEIEQLKSEEEDTAVGAEEWIN